MSAKNPIVWIVILAIVAVGALIAINWISSRPAKPPAQETTTVPAPPTQQEQPQQPSEPAPSPPEQPTKGVADAPVTIAEFAEFYCPYCARHLWQTFPKIDEEYIRPGLVKYVFHNLVVHGAVAQLAAQAGECAHAQGHFWEYHDRLFYVIFEEGRGQLDAEALKTLAQEFGLNVETFASCLDSEWAKAEIEKDRKILNDLLAQVPEAEKPRSIGTPLFFINGRPLVGAWPYEKFKAMIDAELAKREK
ncbi:MAG: DsbA family protein [Candidatus Bipolaricaulota bacterium]|nr:DsbA family protein [Candidatus Bipolaricaulota bacterium]